MKLYLTHPDPTIRELAKTNKLDDIVGKIFRNKNTNQLDYIRDFSSYTYIHLDNNPSSIQFTTWPLETINGNWLTSFLSKSYEEIEKKSFLIHPNKQLRDLAKEDYNLISLLNLVHCVHFLDNKITMVNNHIFFSKEKQFLWDQVQIKFQLTIDQLGFEIWDLDR